MFGPLISALAVGITTIAGACGSITVNSVTPAETAAFCGVHPDSPSAAAAVASLANVAGMDATFGPCMAPGPAYSPSNNDGRYVDPDMYMKLVNLNASVGMKTYVYDARMWSEDPAIRTSAVEFWTPVFGYISGWDMGDEFAPGYEMDILVARWKIVESLGTGILPFTNHLPNRPEYGSAIDRWISQMPDAARQRISFDSYILEDAKTHAIWYRDHTNNLTCAINALKHAGYVITEASIEGDMAELRKVGCRSFLIFGGDVPIGTNGYFGTQSLVDANGAATSWALSVEKGARVSMM